MSEQQILVVKLSSLGDLFHALPAVTMIRKALGWPVDWVTQPEYEELVRCFEGVRDVIVFPRRRVIRGLGTFLRRLRAREYDLALDFQGLQKSAWVVRMARSRWRIGPSYSREGAHWLYHEVAGRRDKNRHAVEEALDFVRALGLPQTDVEFPVRFSKQPLSTPGPRIGLLPCSRWPTKNWPAEFWAEMVRHVAKQSDAYFYVLGSAGDMKTCEQVTREIGERGINLCGKTSLVELGSLLQELDLLATVDSGPMHMAAALGIPVVAVFGATDPIRTGPYGTLHHIFTQLDLPCRPCLSEKCARGDLACLTLLEPPRVAAKVVEVLQRRQCNRAN